VTNLGAAIMAVAIAVGGKGDSLQWIWNKLLEFWPLGQMDEWQRGLRLRNGIVKKQLGPGLYVRIPFIHRVIEVNCAKRTESVTPVPVTTADNVSVRLGMNVRFRIVDVETWLVEVDNPLQTLLNEGESVLTEFGGAIKWNEDWKVRSVNRRITRAMKRRVEGMIGVEVEKAELNCFVEAKAYQVFGDPGSAPLFNDEDD
jgi:regulator of protease activity HflC (stomatin/prohibitin superfamily)